MAPAPQNIESILAAAVELDSECDRQRFVEQVCAGDAELKRRIGRLIENHFRAGSFLGAPAPGLAATIGMPPEPPIAEVPDSVIGPYKLLEQIGEGGFGIVFMAEQLRPVRRKVALKVLKPGMDTRQVIARFEAERQALALMDHPHIARVFDAGATENGHPYFVMELVKGIPITDYCDQHQLTPRERIELFVPVCQAVQHAHQKGIIHRDIKPGNVLVTQHDGIPVVKVIDFGVAKALGQQLTDKTVFTGFAQMIGTPLYMSPEQAEFSGLDVDTRTDIYSLGVLLYELLTGTTPFDKERLKEAGFDEVRRIIREDEPPKPSLRISTLGKAATTVSTQRKSDPRKLQQLFRGDLDWIVMKALEKDRTQRYETASAFAADVGRYLRDEPVEACPPSALYRFRKFARRNKAGITLASIVAVALLVILTVVAGGIGWMAHERGTREAALDADVHQTLDKAESMVTDTTWPEAMAGVDRAEKLLVAAGRKELPQRLRKLRRDLRMIQRLEEIYSGRNNVEYMTGQEQDTAYAEAFRDYGIDVTALPVAEASDRIRATDIARHLVRGLDFWSSMRKRASNQAAPSWKQLLEIATKADADPWRNQFREALSRSDRLALETLSNSADVAKLPPDTLHLLGIGLRDIGAAEQAVALLRRAQEQYPADLWINSELGWLYLTIQPPQYDEALRFYTATLAIRPDNPDHCLVVGQALAGTGKTTEAVAIYTKAIALKPDFAKGFLSRGYMYWHLNQHDKAIADFRKVIELDPNDPGVHKDLGVALGLSGNIDESIAELREAIRLKPDFAMARLVLGEVLSNTGRIVESIAEYREGIRFAPNEPAGHANLGGALRVIGELDEAIRELTEAIRLKPGEFNFHFQLGLALLQKGLIDEAISKFRETIRLKPDFGSAHGVLASVLNLEKHDYAAAIAEYEQATTMGNDQQNNLAWLLATCPNAEFRDSARAVELARKGVGAAPQNGALRNTLGVAHYRNRDWTAAIDSLNQSVELRNGGDAFDYMFLAMSHWQLGNKEEARNCFDRGVEWIEKNGTILEENKQHGEEIRRFRKEAEELMEVK